MDKYDTVCTVYYTGYIINEFERERERERETERQRNRKLCWRILQILGIFKFILQLFQP